MASGPAYILGISCYYHDAAAALIRDGEIIAAAQEERFTRVKHDAGFPAHAVRYCLQEADITPPTSPRSCSTTSRCLKFERILETAVAYAPRGLRSFLTAMPVWLKEKLWIPSRIRSELDFDGLLLFADHHESHAASAFYPSPFERAAILTMDGVGEWTTTSYGRGEGNSDHAARRPAFPAFARTPVLRVHLLHRVQGQLGRVQGDGPRAVRRAEVCAGDLRPSHRPESRRIVPDEHGRTSTTGTGSG